MPLVTVNATSWDDIKADDFVTVRVFSLRSEKTVTKRMRLIEAPHQAPAFGTAASLVGGYVKANGEYAQNQGRYGRLSHVVEFDRIVKVERHQPDAPAAEAEAAPVKLRKADQELLALIADDSNPYSTTYYVPGREHGTNSEARTRWSFQRYQPAAVGFKSFVRVTAPVNRLVEAGLLAVPTTERRCQVVVTPAGRAYLAALNAAAPTEDTRGQYMSDEKLRGLLSRYGYSPFGLERPALLACVRDNNLIERTWADAR